MPSKRALASQAEEVDKPRRARRPKLTTAQLDRKRECDREAQRQIRLKTKNYITHLEGLVRTLQDGGGESARVKQLVQQVQAGHEKINELREVIRGVGKLVEGLAHSSDLETTSTGEDAAVDKPSTDSPFDTKDDSSGARAGKGFSSTSSPGPATVENPEDEASGDLADPDVDDSRTQNDIDDATSIASPGPSMDSVYENLSAIALTRSPPGTVDLARRINAVAEQIVRDRTLDGRLWYLAGCLLNLILRMPQAPQTPVEFEEDIPVRAVLHGWGTVASQYYLDPGWLWLRHLDEALYSALGIPQRLAVMRVMRMQYRAQVRPLQKAALPLPSFMAARPAQEYLDHDPLVEHFVWPGVRERILFSPRKYATNRFMDNFRNHSRFVWPYNPEDTYHRNPDTGMYTYSNAFVDRQNDLRCWSMRSEFFNLFPELRQDIPSFDDSPWNCQMFISSSSTGWNHKLLMPGSASPYEEEKDLDPAADLEEPCPSLAEFFNQPSLSAPG